MFAGGLLDDVPITELTENLLGEYSTDNNGRFYSSRYCTVTYN